MRFLRSKPTRTDLVCSVWYGVKCMVALVGRSVPPVCGRVLGLLEVRTLERRSASSGTCACAARWLGAGRCSEKPLCHKPRLLSRPFLTTTVGRGDESS